MTIKKLLILTLTTSLCFGLAQGCIQRNVTCEEIKDGDLYRYPHECPPSSDVYVDINETMIAYRQGSKHGTETPEMKILNESFVKGNCTDLKIKCTFNDGGGVKDFCETYKATDEPKKNPVHSDPQWGLYTGVPVGVLVFIAITVILVVFGRRISDALHVWKKNTGASCCFGAPRGAFQNGNHDRHEDHQVSDSEEGNELNTDIEKGVVQPAKDPRTDNERNTTLERGQSTDPQPGGTTGTLVSMEDETQAKDGDASVPDEVTNSRDMHRNQRDDPGGVNGIKAEDTVRIKKMQNGWTHGERDAEDDEKNAKNEREPLLPILGSANQASDMTGEATAQVDDSCFKPDPDSKTSITLDTDVESAHYTRNHSVKT